MLNGESIVMPFSRSSYVIDISFMKLQKLPLFSQLMHFLSPIYQLFPQSLNHYGTMTFR